MAFIGLWSGKYGLSTTIATGSNIGLAILAFKFNLFFLKKIYKGEYKFLAATCSELEHIIIT